LYTSGLEYMVSMHCGMLMGADSLLRWQIWITSSNIIMLAWKCEANSGHSDGNIMRLHHIKMDNMVSPARFLFHWMRPQIKWKWHIPNHIRRSSPLLRICLISISYVILLKSFCNPEYHWILYFLLYVSRLILRHYNWYDFIVTLLVTQLPNFTLREI
jgi:hypothetical protein